ncbi:hypothetical protein CA54_01530 [Symmachiella macrocystis]|uniref:Uncharacterized protein n=1 Tax=Symmachiella macrocystis TaxID=2527985 RepID=A0A5C6BJ21_9PLAN|nr:hypothetical protein CA54_01530 [Symmachiella macrocystis]
MTETSTVTKKPDDTLATAVSLGAAVAFFVFVTGLPISD